MKEDFAHRRLNLAKITYTLCVRTGHTGVQALAHLYTCKGQHYHIFFFLFLMLFFTVNYLKWIKEI